MPLLSPSNRNYGYVGKPAFKPTDCCGATPAWDAFWFVLPWESYQRYGDLRALERTYPAMQKYLDDWIPQWTAQGRRRYAYTLTSGLGDWVPPKGVPTINALVVDGVTTRGWRASPPTPRARSATGAGARSTTRCSRRSRRDFNARFLGTGRRLPGEGRRAVRADRADPAARLRPRARRAAHRRRRAARRRHHRSDAAATRTSA